MVSPEVAVSTEADGFSDISSSLKKGLSEDKGKPGEPRVPAEAEGSADTEVSDESGVAEDASVVVLGALCLVGGGGGAGLLGESASCRKSFTLTFTQQRHYLAFVEQLIVLSQLPFREI